MPGDDPTLLTAIVVAGLIALAFVSIWLDRRPK